jgi:pimeloyl-ACP methyl ester carboxylesterase
VKPNLLLLHGALGASTQFDPLLEKLNLFFDVFTFDFSGHGKNKYDGHLTMDVLADDIKVYMDDQKLTSCFIFGYSMGGYAAVNLAINKPKLVLSIMTLGTKWSWDKNIAAKEIKMLDNDVISEKLPFYAEMLRLRHSGQGWKALLQRTAEMMIQLGDLGGMKTADLAIISVPVNVCLGSEDRMVTLEESTFVAQNIPEGTLTLLSGLQHPLEKVDLNLLANEIKNWFLR